MNTKLIRGILPILLLLCIKVNSQTVQGKISDAADSAALQNVSVYALHSKTGATSDSDGRFSLLLHLPDTLLFSHAGYTTDTLYITHPDFINHWLSRLSQLSAVVVTAGQQSSYVDRLSVIKTEVITARELTKAACCNLSESFGSSVSIDVSNADAISGSKEILLFSLEGNYVQINTENVPAIRGLNTSYGLSYIPGTWIHSINIGKGAGSVVNGYESMTGQINVELLKPDLADKFYVNSYYNSMGRSETNVHYNKPLNQQWSTGLYASVIGLGEKMDQNKDNFYDAPVTTQYNILNRWKKESKYLKLNFGLHGVYDRKKGGQLEPTHNGSSNLFEYTSTVKRLQGHFKLGKLYPKAPFKSLAIIASTSYHQQRARIGLKDYEGQQGSVYINTVLQNIISHTGHQYKIGASFMADDYQEEYIDAKNEPGVKSRFSRRELVPGLYAEYTNKSIKKTTLIAGNRLDYNSVFGLFYTPRFHFIYNPTAKSAIRLSSGKGYRTANLFAENLSLLSSSRRVQIQGKILPEKSWTHGISLTQTFRLLGNKADLVVDAYRTSFINQLVIDRETDARVIGFSNLEGRSFANSLQAEIGLMPLKRLELKIGYKWNEVKSTFNSILKEQPFVIRRKALLTTSYNTGNKAWTFSHAIQAIGKQRVLTNAGTPDFLQTVEWSKPYLFLNAHVNRRINSHWEFYVGGENLGNFTQSQPIVNASHSFAPSFDASLVWGPLTDRMFYTGFRYKRN